MNEFNIVVFSSGFDSTLILYDLLKEGKDVVTVEFEASFSGKKVNREKDARNRIINYLSSKFYNQKITRNIISIDTSKLSIQSFGLTQPLFWIPSALLCTSLDSKNYIHFGYIQGDHADVEAISTIIDAASKMQFRKEFICKFPLRFTDKTEVISRLITEDLFLFENCTTCESFRSETDFCGECIPCKHLISSLTSLVALPGTRPEIKEVASKYLSDKFGISMSVSLTKKNTGMIVPESCTPVSELDCDELFDSK